MGALSPLTEEDSRWNTVDEPVELQCQLHLECALRRTPFSVTENLRASRDALIDGVRVNKELRGGSPGICPDSKCA